jgi:hypothetical protein
MPQLMAELAPDGEQGEDDKSEEKRKKRVAEVFEKLCKRFNATPHALLDKAPNELAGMLREAGVKVQIDQARVKGVLGEWLEDRAREPVGR